MSLLNYFKPANKSFVYPSPQGSLSKVMPSSHIEEANKKVLEVMLASETKEKATKPRGPYSKYSQKDKAKIGNYALLHGTNAALRHFKSEYDCLKWTTVNDWKTAILKLKKTKFVTEGKSDLILEIKSKKRGRPSILTDELYDELKAYIIALRTAGGVVNSAIVIAAGTGILQRNNPSSLECNGGSVVLKKSWAKYFLGKLNFVKRKATTKSKLTVKDFEQRKLQYLIDIKAVVEFEDIPNELIINWDQTGINYVPVSQWTMALEGSKRVEVAGVTDKRQITAVFGGSLSGDFLPVQLIYQGKTSKSIPSVTFPAKWHVTVTPNHWSNENTMVAYIQAVLIPYIVEKRKALNLPEDHPALVIFDEFTGQTTDVVLKLLGRNNILYVIVPPNCTDRLQPLDVSVNKAAKEFLRSQFQTWYADKVADQMEGGKSFTPVDLKLSIVKPVGAKWLIKLYDYFKTKPEIIINGFKGAGISDFLTS